MMGDWAIQVLRNAGGQFHVTTDTTQKNKSSYAEYLVLVLYCTHITCHGFKGNICRYNLTIMKYRLLNSCVKNCHFLPWKSPIV